MDSLSKLVMKEVVEEQGVVNFSIDSGLIYNNKEIEMYRVAHPTTLHGVYTHDSDEFPPSHLVYITELANTHNCLKRTPNIYEDEYVATTLSFINESLADAVYGTCSKKQLMRWFNKKELRDLHSLGFKLYKFKTSCYKIYQRQTITDLCTWLKSEKEVIDIKNFLLTEFNYK